MGEKRKIVVVNAGHRKGWNTDTLLEEAAKGARHETVFTEERKAVYELGRAL